MCASSRQGARTQYKQSPSCQLLRHLLSPPCIHYPMLQYSLRQQVSSLCRGLAALELIPWHSYQQQVQLSNRSAPEPSCADSEVTIGSVECERKFSGVKKKGKRWVASVNIPQHMLPDRSGSKVYFYKYGFSSPEAAAREVDILRLTLRGQAARKRLNFPNFSYSKQQVAEQQANLLAKYPDINFGAVGVYSKLCIYDVSGLQTALKAAADRVAGIYDGSTELVGFSNNDNSPRIFRVQLRVAGIHYQLIASSEIAAACGYDLVRMAVHGPTHSVNFPPDTYDSSWVVAAADDVELTRPGMIEVAKLIISPPDYYCLEACRAADAAVALEAAAALKAGRAMIAQPVGCYPVQRAVKVQASVHTKWQGRKDYAQLTRNFKAYEQAACAADLIRLASGKPAVNLPTHSYNDSSITAMRAWMNLDARRKAKWAARKKQIERPKQRSKKVTGKQLGRG